MECEDTPWLTMCPVCDVLMTRLHRNQFRWCAGIEFSVSCLLVSSHPSNPAFHCVFNSNYKILFNIKLNFTPTLGIKMHQHILDSDIDLGSIAENVSHQSLCSCLNLLCFYSPSAHLTSKLKYLPLYTEQNSMNSYLNLMVTCVYLLMDLKLAKQWQLPPF